MLAIKYRPVRFDDVAGQDYPISIFKGALKHRDSMPRSFVVSGHWGCGKTTLVRIFARELNNLSGCSEAQAQRFYFEFDSSVMGRVEDLRKLREDFFYSTSEYIKVICFDEMHLVSRTAQGSLLKVLEAPPPNVVFVFVTTEADKVLKTILSRSVEVELALLSPAQIERNLRRVIALEGITASDKVIQAVVWRSGGHVRDSLMLLDSYLLVGEDEFLKTALEVREQISQYFREAMQGQGLSLVAGIVSKPLHFVKSDLESLIMESMELFYSNKPCLFSHLDMMGTMRFFTYYVQNKREAFLSSSDLYSFFLILGKLLQVDRGEGCGARTGRGNAGSNDQGVNAFKRQP